MRWLVLLGLAGGGYWLYRQQQESKNSEGAPKKAAAKKAAVRAECESLLDDNPMLVDLPDPVRKLVVDRCAEVSPKKRRCFEPDYPKAHEKECMPVVSPVMGPIMEAQFAKEEPAPSGESRVQLGPTGLTQGPAPDSLEGFGGYVRE